MKIDVRFRGLEASETLRRHVQRRINAQLSRFGHEISTVVVRLSDLNGPKGGLDKRCQVHLRGPRIGSATIRELSHDARTAVDLAVGRMSFATGKKLERVRRTKAYSRSTSMT
jgi:ribosome-associated translation inhibitor RaiA